MPSTALAERPDAALALPKEQIDLIRRTVANGATNDELALFLYDCQRRGIHPLDKLLHFTKRGGKYTPVTSIDFMRSQAAMSGEMAGSEDAIFSERDDAAGVGHLDLVAATVTVYRITQGQRFAYTATARWSEYCPDNAQMWKRMPHTMLAKCAEALALRKAFPQQLAGLYAKEELDQADRETVLVVEAPAVHAQARPVSSVERSAPSKPNGGDSDSRPSGAEVLEGTAHPSGSIEGPELHADDLVDDLPAGCVRITKVSGGFANGKAKGFISHSGQRAGEDGLPIYSDQLRALAEQVCQSGDTVRLTLKTSAAGKDYIVGIERDLPF